MVVAGAAHVARVGLLLTKRTKRKSGWDDIDGGSAFMIPVTTLRHPNCSRLSSFAVKLLFDLARQYTGFNNGYLCASWALMKDAGWNSAHTVRKATLECEHFKMLVRTQQGGKNKPNLHAFTWRRINEKPGQPLELAAGTEPSHAWKELQPDFVMPAPRCRRRQSLPTRRAA